MIVYVATTNEGKLRELRELTAGSDLQLITDDLYEEVDEDEDSYPKNAALKARSYRRILLEHGVQACVLADDSGLEVAALDGRPGLYTARYGSDLAWPARRAKLLDELRDASSRDARFVCALHFIDEQGRETATFGTVDGAIATEDRGEGGFSYDSIFMYPPLNCTFAELRIREKNAVSHRARAIGNLLSAIAIDDQHAEGADTRRTMIG